MALLVGFIKKSYGLNFISKEIKREKDWGMKSMSEARRKAQREIYFYKKIKISSVYLFHSGPSVIR